MQHIYIVSGVGTINGKWGGVVVATVRDSMDDDIALEVLNEKYPDAGCVPLRTMELPDEMSLEVVESITKKK